MAVVVIPARGGSKRVPGKNIRGFAGKPMIAWSIEAALNCAEVKRVLVSTDDDAVADIARRYGAEVPFKRPAALADDFASTADVMQHAAQWLQQDGEPDLPLCCLYATAPFVTADWLTAGLNALQHSSWDYVFSATEFDYPIQRALRQLPDGGAAFIQPQYAASRSQDLEPVLHDAGQFYWGRSSAFLHKKNILAEHSKPLMLPRRLVVDIDTEDDWYIAEALFKHARSKHG